MYNSMQEPYDIQIPVSLRVWHFFLMLLPKNSSQKQNTELCEKVLDFFIYNLLHLNSLTMFQTSASFHSINKIKIFSFF